MRYAAALDTTAIVAMLRRLVPPTSIIDVGIGRGTGAMHEWRDWGVATACLVDSEHTQLAWAEPLTATHPQWQVHCATLAEADSDAPYYHVSNSSESGLVPTSILTALWPNLHETEKAVRPTTRLDTLLASVAVMPECLGCWLIVDCLPALRVLQGATGTLERCSVLWLRALLQPLSENVAGTTLEDLKKFLLPLGFHCIHVTEGNHPALGDALFVRDWAQWLKPVISELQASNAQCQHQNQLLETHVAVQEAAKEVTLKESEAQAKLAATAQVQLDKLEAEKVVLTSKLSASEKVQIELTGKLAAAEKKCAAASEASAAARSEAIRHGSERDAQAKLAIALQAKLEASIKDNANLTSKSDALSRTNAELAQKLAEFSQQQSMQADALKAAQATVTTRTSERDAQTKRATERQAKIDALLDEKTDLTLKLEGQTKLATERQEKLDALADLTAKFDVLNKTHAELTDRLAVSTQQQDVAEDALKAAQATLTERTTERDVQAKLAAERGAKLEALAKEKAELTDRFNALGTTHSELVEKLASSAQQQGTTANALKVAQTALTKCTEELDAKTTLAAEHKAKIEAFVKEKSDSVAKLEAQTRLATEYQAKLGAITKEKVELTAKLDALGKMHSGLADKLVASNQQQAATADALKIAQAALTELTGKRDAQNKLVSEHQKKAEALLKEKSELSAKLEEQAKLAGERQTQLDAIGKENRVLTGKLVAADEAKLESSKRSDNLQKQADQLTKARDEQAKLAVERANQLTQLTSQNDNLSKENQTLKSNLQGKDAAITKLKEQITEQDHRELQLVEEIVRAEAQIELIKDLLLRDGGL